MQLKQIFFYFQIDQPSYGIDQEFLTTNENDNKTIMAYLKYMINVAILFGADTLTAAIEMQNALDFEIELSKVIVLTRFIKLINTTII